MKRLKFKEVTFSMPDAILTSDWHLRDDQPVCRTDDFWNAQWDKITKVRELQEKYSCPVLHAGDLFHHWKPSPWLLSYAITELPERFYTIYGQHDLPNHNLELQHKSGINVLRQAGVVRVLPEASWGQEPKNGSSSLIEGVLVWHKFVWDGKHLPWPGFEIKNSAAKQILKKYPQFDLIVTGDHHNPFVEKLDGRLLVNPGCLTVQEAGFKKFRPRVYLWYAKSNTVIPVYLDEPKGAVSRSHLEGKEARDKRIDAFVTRLSDDWEAVVSFEENLKRFLHKNHIRKAIRDTIYKAIEND